MRKAWNRLSMVEVRKIVADIGGVLVSTEFEGSNKKMDFMCTCGEIYQTNLSNFKTRKQVLCRSCSTKRRITKTIKPPEVFIRELQEVGNGQYTLLSEYKNGSTKVKVRHACGFEYDVLPPNILRGRQCPKCVGRVKTKDTEYYRQEIRDMVGDEYTLVSEYVSSRTKVALVHNKCGYQYEATPNDFQQGKRCPRCRESRGERRVSEALDSLGKEYRAQYAFPELKGLSGRVLVFDFAVMGADDTPAALIEYDGEFHYKANPFSGEAGLARQQAHDAMKDEYCEENNIRLIRIPYWKLDEIETILKDAI